MATLTTKLFKAFAPLLPRNKEYGLTQRGFNAVLLFPHDEDKAEEAMAALSGWDLRSIRKVATRLAAQAREEEDDDLFDAAETLREIASELPHRRSLDSVAAGKKPLCLVCLRALRTRDPAWIEHGVHKSCQSLLTQESVL